MFSQKNINMNRNSLYVGNLDETVTDQDLANEFSKYGKVLHTHVVLDRETKKSRCYGYVNFGNADDTDSALNSANFTKLKGKEMRVMLQMNKFKNSTNNKGNVFVKNLPNDMDGKQLMDKFSTYGNIISCKVAYDKASEKSLNYGYVHFSDPAVAAKVIEELNKDIVDDGDIYAMEYEKKAVDTSAEWTNCYIGNFPASVSKEQLIELFEKYGKVTSAFVGKKPYDEGKVHGFVNFAKHEDAVKAAEEMKDKEITMNGETFKILVNKHQSREERARLNATNLQQKKKEEIERTKGRFLYVGFGSEAMTEDELRAIFAKFGTVETCSIAKDKITKQNKPFGFVCMDSVENATAALNTLKADQNNKLKIELAQTRSERSKILREKHRMPNGNMYMNMAYPMGMNYSMNPMNRQPMRGPNANKRYPMQSMPMPMNGMPMGGMQQPMRGMQQGMPMGMPQQGMPMGMPQQGMPMGMPQQGYMNNYMNTGMMNERVEKINVLKSTMSTLPPLDPESIASMNDEERRNTFGERIFTLISAINDPRVSKITGMMLELAPNDLMIIVNDAGELYNKIIEANEVLNQSGQN